LKPVLLDTGVIVALLDRSERYHQASVAAVEELAAPLVTCEAVIVESCYLLRKLPGAVEAVLENVAAGTFQIPLSLSQSARSIQKIVRKYRDRQIDLADACLIHLAGELHTGDVLTLDRDFQVYRWRGTNRFRPVPQL
jgi:predicted nucleic acid-binding protein